MALAPRASERLMRLKGDLRLGLPVILLDHGEAALVAWAETLTEDRFAALAAMGRAELALTRHRARALGSIAMPPGDVLRAALPPTAGLDWITTQAGGVADSGATPCPLPPLASGSAIHRAATTLAQSAQVLPAAVIVPLREGPDLALSLGLTVMQAHEVTDTLAAGAHHDRVSSAPLPMAASDAGRVHVFRPEDGGIEHSAIEVGTPDLSQPVLVRLHSACFTGDVLGSLKCDCGPQLHAAMAAMAGGDGGVLLYLNQEGRGIGLANKMRAYALQDSGLDTVEANQWLGFDDDLRDFRTGAQMLARLGIQRVRLMTNNPRKVDILTRHGVDVVERVPLQAGRTPQNERYLATKAAKSGHIFT
ncbi:GTP cyclohydrolase II [Roseivivax jejudonensis]|uniref:GTP cyclohydrolase II n=1 Tax=Roseivivax jejudonensis TaxID=1529041 RepID=UPI000A26C24F|nr:GTP cyclohydrolase II [Roseivivax jejudonensis]